MTRDDDEYYQAQFDMFASKGWTDFCDECQDVLRNAHTLIEAATSELTLGHVQAAIRLRREIVGREALVQATYNELMAEVE